MSGLNNSNDVPLIYSLSLNYKKKNAEKNNKPSTKRNIKISIYYTYLYIKYKLSNKKYYLKMSDMEIDKEDNEPSSLIKKENAKLIPIKDRRTSRFLTKFERARVIGERAIQISNNSDVYVDVPEGMWDPLKIAEKELKERKIPFVIRRYLPNGEYEDWEVNDLIFD